MLNIVITFIILSVLTPLLYRWINPPFTPLMLSRKITIGAPIKHKWVDLKDISPYLINCAVAAEDNHFLGHNGFDFGAIQKAIEERDKGRFRGASTISQQAAKNVFLWQGKSWLRKGLEVYFTFLIETFWSKERIMEVYLNVIEMGKGIYGAEAAAQCYFKKSAENLSQYQAALIVAAFPNPLERNPAKPSRYLAQRAKSIIALSQKVGAVNFNEKSINLAREQYKKSEKKRREKSNGQLLNI
ncbi:MAG: monofunctional biosynthetic peptidoglycan transglycosylase [Dysgonamonadaceae bacterium]|nr:monofunctional biosynthetic peptidoglycan transglycosylase [Dysgonamonadaceae bacterium]